MTPVDRRASPSGIGCLSSSRATARLSRMGAPRSRTAAWFRSHSMRAATRQRHAVPILRSRDPVRALDARGLAGSIVGLSMGGMIGQASRSIIRPAFKPPGACQRHRTGPGAGRRRAGGSRSAAAAITWLARRYFRAFAPASKLGEAGAAPSEVPAEGYVGSLDAIRDLASPVVFIRARDASVAGSRCGAGLHVGGNRAPHPGRNPRRDSGRRAPVRRREARRVQRAGEGVPGSALALDPEALERLGREELLGLEEAL